MQLPSAVREFRVGAIFLAAALALTVAYFVVPRGAAQDDINEVIGIASALAIVLGVRLNRPSFPLPWLLFAAGNLLFAVGDVVFNKLDNPPTPSAADWFYLAGYPALAAGLVLLLIRGGGHHRTAALGEAAIVTF
ncbi:MAG: GGDEF-domain containing protein, partial [Actinomycetota bacterium]|nr:GGDEF-domain containing protein [Actinomycetota bacterium]